MLLALIATTLSLQTGAPQRASAPADSMAFLKTIAAAEQKFFQTWNAAWRKSEAPRRRGEGAWRDPSKADLSCNPDPAIYVPDFAWGSDFRLRRIASTKSSVGVCPNWFPFAGFYIRPPKDVVDERLGVDGALAPTLRREIRAARGELIATLESAVRKMPQNALLNGQLVRMLVEQGELDRALKAARDCQSLDWWCNALTGFVLARRGDNAGAELSLKVAADGLVDADRCDWSDVSALLDTAGAAAYKKMPCDEREQFNERFWWLTDALWLDTINDRRTEQAVRRVKAVLHSSMGHDERYDWRPAAGGDAIDETVRRYGWPTYTYWGPNLRPGLPADSPLLANLKGVATPPDPFVEKVIREFKDCQYDSRGKELPGTCLGIDLRPTLAPETLNDGKPNQGRAYNGATEWGATPDYVGSTFEYSIGRVHLVPAWRALSAPFTATNWDWNLNAPRKDPVAKVNWWPQEHYLPPQPVRQFVDQQTAFLRRQNAPLLAFASALGQTDLGREASDTVVASMMTSTGPGAISTVTAKRTPATSLLVFLESIPRNPSVISIEIPAGRDSAAAGRTRFGVTPPPTLSAMSAGDKAISDPVLLSAPPSLDALPLNAADAIPMMLGSTALQFGTPRVGVYWETYGFGDRDTLEVTLRVARVNPLSLAQRVGVATSLIADPNAPVVASWREPDQVHRTQTIAGVIPTQMRSVVIDISTLVLGDYVLEISVGKPGTTPVKSQREFTIR